MRWRPREEINIALSSDFNYAKQTIDYFNKSRAGTVTVYPQKKLTYVKTEPTLTIIYLNDGGKQIHKDEFSSLTKALILKNQSLFELEFKRGITNLYKGSTGGTQNIIDPYNIFIYPVEYFVFGTEYAFPFAGNYSYGVGNINAQNYYQLKGSAIYGLMDSFNAGLPLGYYSASSQHNFIVPDYANRFSKFKPYYFIDPSFDSRVTKNSLLSLKSHIVPNYKTFFKETTIDRKGESSYYEAIITFRREESNGGSIG